LATKLQTQFPDGFVELQFSLRVMQGPAQLNNDGPYSSESEQA